MDQESLLPKPVPIQPGQAPYNMAGTPEQFSQEQLMYLLQHQQNLHNFMGLTTNPTPHGVHKMEDDSGNETSSLSPTISSR